MLENRCGSRPMHPALAQMAPPRLSASRTYAHVSFEADRSGAPRLSIGTLTTHIEHADRTLHVTWYSCSESSQKKSMSNWPDVRQSSGLSWLVVAMSRRASACRRPALSVRIIPALVYRKRRPTWGALQHKPHDRPCDCQPCSDHNRDVASPKSSEKRSAKDRSFVRRPVYRSRYVVTVYATLHGVGQLVVFARYSRR